MRSFHEYSPCQSIGIKRVESSMFGPVLSMARVKDVLEIQKDIIHVLWKAGKTQKLIAVEVGCSCSAVAKITR